MRLRSQFLLSHLAVILTVALFVAVSLFFLIKQLTVRMLEEEQARQMRSFTQMCLQSAVQKNDILLAGQVKIVGAEPGIAYAYFADGQGRIRMHTDPNFLFKPETEWTPHTPALDAAESREKVTADGKYLGTAVIGFARDYRRDLLKASTRRLALWIATGALLGAGIGVFISSFLSDHLAHPLREMAVTAGEIGDGRFEAKVKPLPALELDVLGRALNRMGDNLKHLEDMRNEFISVVSHDLMSPLGAIVTAADYLEESGGGALNEEQKECIKAIADKGMQVSRFAGTLLELAKARAGKMDYVMRRMDATALLRRLAQFYRPTAKKLGAEIQCEMPSQLFFTADEEKIERALTNLLSNALKFVPKPGGRVRLSAAAEEQGTVFTVQDNGPGISPEDQGKLFQKFVRLNVRDQADKKISGNGIGLSITKEIVEGHGGRIWIESAAGGGASFVFRIPDPPRA